jgi:CheY-like chemotaxis protein
MRSDCVLIEPSLAIRGFCSRMLAEREIDTRIVGSTIDALTAVCERQPAVIISSVELPDFPGTSLLAALRESPAYRAIPVVILSGDKESFELSSTYQPDVLIAKDSELDTNLDAFLDKIGLIKPAALKSDASSLQLSLAGRRILLAEDSRVNQVLTSRMLHVAGAEVVVVENGRDALAATASSSFDLVLMDIEMPIMDGREATLALRDSGSDLPILAMTGHEGDEFMAEAKILGFNEVLSKKRPPGDLVRACLVHMAA